MTSDHVLMTGSMGLLPSVGRERTNEPYLEYIEIQNNARRLVCHLDCRRKAREWDNGSEPRMHCTKNPLRPLANLVLESIEEKLGCF
jgi:hypothetical protein